jgi:uncharacterized protein (TIGR00255 family)
VSIRAPGTLAARESDIEQLTLKTIKRGSVTVTVSLRSRTTQTPAIINEDVALAYQAAFKRLGLPEQAIPQLPGVIVSHAPEAVTDEEWRGVGRALERALAGLAGMRDKEGSALKDALVRSTDKLSELRQQVVARIPVVLGEHQTKLRERLNALLEGSGFAIDEATLAREVAVLVDRGDVTEELDRLASHLQQTRDLLAAKEPVGRTLEFVAQEMLREVNTIGSKSADAELARLVIEMKSEVERFKEQVANVE